MTTSRHAPKRSLPNHQSLPCRAIHFPPNTFFKLLRDLSDIYSIFQSPPKNFVQTKEAFPKFDRSSKPPAISLIFSSRELLTRKYGRLSLQSELAPVFGSDIFLVRFAHILHASSCAIATSPNYNVVSWFTIIRRSPELAADAKWQIVQIAGN